MRFSFVLMYAGLKKNNKTPHIELVWEPGSEKDRSEKLNIVDQAAVW